MLLRCVSQEKATGNRLVAVTRTEIEELPYSCQQALKHI
jgi:hypothetical protein